MLQYYIQYSMSCPCTHVMSHATIKQKRNKIVGFPFTITKAKFRRRTSHEPNRMQMRKILCSPSLAFDSAHVKYVVWTWPKFIAHGMIVNLEEKWLDKILGFNCGHSVLGLRFFSHHSLWTKNMIWHWLQNYMSLWIIYAFLKKQK